MVRNFLSGLALGGVVAGVGLGVASQMVPLDPSKVAEIMVAGDTLPAGDDPAKEAPGATPDTSSVEAPADAAPKMDGPEPVRGTPTDAGTPAMVPEAEKSDTLLAPLPEPTLPEPTLPETAAVTSDPQPVAPVADSPEASVPDSSLPTTAVPETTTPAPADPSQADSTTPKADAVAEGATQTPPPTAPTAENAQPEAGAANPADPTAESGALAKVTDAPTLPAASPLEPAGSIADQEVAGVTTGRLPRIGAEADAQDAPADAADSLSAPSGVDAALPPVKRFAQAFENPGAKPLFAVLLIDPGTGDVNRAELASLPFPVTFVVDPMAANAAEAAKTYRDAGQEVVMLANGIPKGANAGDLEQSFAKLTETLPEAVALIDTADATFQDNRGLAGEVVTLLAAQGRGVVTFDRGLNAADQVARREGVPSATIFRSLDDDGEDAPLIRRYLDRAAFKAAQEGQVVVIGTARPETIAALMEWAVEGRAASVALAPITAVMATK